jgi:hypothetical protein
MSSAIQANFMESVRERTLILTQDPIVEKLRIVHYLLLFGNINSINLRPGYQRELRWSHEQYNDFIGTIMVHGYIPNIVIYKLHDDDARDLESHENECIDGQHRIFAMSNFKNSEPININGKDVMISWHHKQSNTYVFYMQNEHTEKWKIQNSDKKMAYFTSKEKNDFDEYRISIERITCKLTYEQRCDMFVSLQKGIPVRNSDLYKNFIDIPLISFISKEKKLETLYNNFVSKRLTTNSIRNWLFCLVRICMICISESLDDINAWVDTTDTQIKKTIKIRADNIMNLTTTDYQLIEYKLNRLFSLLNRLPENILFTPIKMLSTFVYLQNSDIGKEETLIKRLTNGWAGKGTKDEKRMWFQKEFLDDNGRISPQKNYYNECLNYLSSEFEPIENIPIEPRKPLNKKKRQELWIINFQKNNEGNCYVCSKSIKKEDKWHAGHIVAHAKGGSDTELGNYVIECPTCNLNHGTEDPNTYKKRNYSKSIDT